MDIGEGILKHYVELLLASEKATNKHDEYYATLSWAEETESGMTPREEKRLAQLEAAAKLAELRLDSMLQLLKEWGRTRYPNLRRFMNKNA